MANSGDSIGISDNNSSGFARELFEWTEALVTALAIMMVVMLFILRPATVEGASMVPTLENGDRLIFTDMDYTPERGDIVIVDSEGLGKFIVKRVIATGGQTIDIDFITGAVTVDGVLLQEDYINGETLLDVGGHVYPVTVPADSVFVMGDNRLHSTDSRDNRVGFIKSNDIFGKVVLRVYPFEKMGFIK